MRLGYVDDEDSVHGVKGLTDAKFESVEVTVLCDDLGKEEEKES